MGKTTQNRFSIPLVSPSQPNVGKQGEESADLNHLVADPGAAAVRKICGPDKKNQQSDSEGGMKRNPPETVSSIMRMEPCKVMVNKTHAFASG